MRHIISGKLTPAEREAAIEAPSLTSAEQERLEAYDRAAKEPVVVNDDMALAFFRAITDESVSSDDVDECKIGLRAAFANISPPLPVVPDEMSFNDAAAFILNNGMANEDRATIAMRAYNHCRAAMLQSVERKS